MSNQIKRRTLSTAMPLVLGMVCALASGLFESRAVAGCYHQNVGEKQLYDAQVDTLHQWFSWSAAKTTREYVDGHFRYYPVIDVPQPCRGPQCRGGKSESDMAAVPIIEQSRHPAQNARLNQGVRLGQDTTDLIAVCDFFPHGPDPDGPFRPPA